MANDSTSTARPKALGVIPENIPGDLTQRVQWVVWRYEWVNEKWTKVPYQTNGTKASHSDPTTWTSFAAALECYQAGGFDGIGFVFTAESQVVGIDLDHIFNGSPERSAWGNDIVQRVNSYSELSPSSDGAHIFVVGRLPPNGRRKDQKKGFEIYSTQRFFTVTGVRLDGFPPTVEPRQEQIDKIYAEIFGQNRKRSTNGDDGLLARAFANGVSGDKVKRLFDGDISEYGSQSEADLGLCSMLAFYAKDKAQLDRLFRSSALFREKWDEVHFGNGQTYGVHTLERALADKDGLGGYQDGGGDKPELVTLDTVKPQKVEWLWQNRIPIGRVTSLDGDPGSGKSFVTLRISAAVTRGEELPGGKKPDGPSNVLLMSIEDGFADTVRPRLDALGADVSKIVIPNPERGLAPSLLNAAFIERAVKETGPALVVIDPIIAFTGKRDSDKAGQVRELLSPLMALAERHAFACVIVRHLTKDIKMSKALYRGMGSIDWMAAVRSAFMIGENEEGQRVLAHVKNSLGEKAPSLSFSIYEENGVATFRWDGIVATVAEDLLATNQRESRQLDTAVKYLEELLGNGPMPSNEAKAKAKKAGISSATLWRAKDILEIVPSKERGTSGKWWWRLPDGDGT